MAGLRPPSRYTRPACCALAVSGAVSAANEAAWNVRLIVLMVRKCQVRITSAVSFDGKSIVPPKLLPKLVRRCLHRQRPRIRGSSR